MGSIGDIGTCLSYVHYVLILVLALVLLTSLAIGSASAESNHVLEQFGNENELNHLLAGVPWEICPVY